MTFFYCKKRLVIFYLLIIIFVSYIFNYQLVYGNSDISDMNAKAFAVMDGYSGRVLIGNQSNEALSNASTTKILTCIIALENGTLTDWVAFSKEAVAQPEVKLDVKEGVSLTIKDLLYCIMLESYNDCAYAIAEYISKDINSFSALMNKKAEEIGCKDSLFLTPNGLDRENDIGSHHSTAEDLCRIMKYCCYESPCAEEFVGICRTQSIIVEDSTGVKHGLNNHNRFLESESNNICGKTGYTSKAGYCYIGAFEKDSKRYLICVLGCGWPGGKDYRWQTTLSLLKYVQDKYYLHILSPSRNNSKIVIKGYGRYKDSTLSDWNQPRILNYNIEKKDIYVLVSDDDLIRKEIDIPHKKIEWKDGMSIGRINYYINNEEILSCKVYVAEPLYEWKLSVLLTKIIYQYFG